MIKDCRLMYKYDSLIYFSASLIKTIADIRIYVIESTNGLKKSIYLTNYSYRRCKKKLRLKYSNRKYFKKVCRFTS